VIAPAFISLPYDTGTLLIIAIIVLTTTALSAVAGFGFGTVAVPMLLLVLPPSAVVVIIKVVGTGTVWIVLLSVWRKIRWRTILKILPAAFAGLLVGGYILREAEPAAIQLFVGVLVLISALTLIAKPVLIERDAVWSTSLVGFLTGVMGNATGLLAPAVVVYFTGRQFPRDVFRATTLALFLTIDMIGLPTLALQGAVSWADMQFALLLVPLAIIGRMVGLRLVRFVSQQRFRSLTVGLLFVMATTTIVTATGSLLG
jgi:uncharacterized membrane protein YfcA